MAVEPVVGIGGVQAPHDAVARDLGDDRGGRDRRARAVAADDRAVLALERHAEAVGQEQRPGRRVQSAQGARQGREVGAVHAAAVDLARRRDDHADARGAREDGLVELLALCERARLRVVELRERRAHAALQAPVVEEHAGRDERARERAATRLVGARDERHAERAIVTQQPVAGPQELASGAVADGDGHARRA